MDLNHFDTTFKSALENIEVPYDSESWNALERKLDVLPVPDRLDEAIRPGLDRFEATYDANSWSALSARLDQLIRIRKLRLTKLAEAAIFLLLLLNLKGFFSIVESATKPVPPNQKTMEPIAKWQASPEKNRHPSQTTSRITAGAETDKSLLRDALEYLQNSPPFLTQSTDSEGFITYTTRNDTDFKARSVLDPDNFYSQSEGPKFSINPVLPLKNAGPIPFAHSLIPIRKIENHSTDKPSRFYAATYGTFEKNYFRDGDFSKQSNGYGTGFSVGFRIGKWGIETGLAFSAKNYQPKSKNVVYLNNPIQGFAFYTIDAVQADVFALPVKATRQIAKSGKTSAHLVAGVTANYATNKTYHYKTAHYPQVNPQNPLVKEYLPNAKGVLENGGLAHNVYASADLGLRIAHSIGKRYNAFVEPLYHQSIGGNLGPKSGRINSFSLQAGVMASL